MASRQKITDMIGVIRAIYPYYAKDGLISITAKTWEVVLAKYTDKEVGVAFELCLQTCKMPPTPADIIEKINAVNKALSPTGEELWKRLVETLKECAELYDRFGFTAIEKNGLSQGKNARNKTEKIWDNLPSELKEYCGGYGEMMRMANNFDPSDTFERNRFLKRIATIEQTIEYKGLALSSGMVSENNLLER